MMVVMVVVLVVVEVIFQPVNDFMDKYMIPISSESFKTPSLTSHITQF